MDRKLFCLRLLLGPVTNVFVCLSSVWSFSFVVVATVVVVVSLVVGVVVVAAVVVAAVFQP